MEDCDGRQVVGMDLHRRRSVLVRMTGDGRRPGTAKITSSPAGLRTVIARAGKSPRVVLEATYGWDWAADVLAAAGAEVHLAHPLGVKAFGCRRVKTDLLTELTTGSFEEPARSPGLLARLAARDQRRGCATEIGWAGGAAGRVA